jgi:membrane protein
MPAPRATRVGTTAAELRTRAAAIASRTPGFPIAFVAHGRDRRCGGGLLAGALAFRLFGALLPLALLTAITLGYAANADGTAPDAVGDAVGIRSALLDSVAESSKLSAGARWSAAAFATVALVWSAMAAARAIRAVHALAWNGGVPRFGRQLTGGLVLIATLAAFIAVWGGVSRARAELGVAGLFVAVTAIVPFFGIWLGVSRLLPHDEASWTALVPGAVLVACGMQLVHLGTVLFIGGRVEHASATYGTLGVAFALLAWLYVISRVIVTSAMLNAALWERSRSYPES